MSRAVHPMNPLGVRALYLGTTTYRIHGHRCALDDRGRRIEKAASACSTNMSSIFMSVWNPAHA